MATNYDSLNAQLKNDPGYQAALAGTLNVGQFPTGPDGLVLPNFRTENARYYAQKKFGNGVGGGAITDSGQFYDPNADHWYSDPRVLGPIAVGAATGGALLAGAPAAAAGASGAGATTAVPSMPWTIPAGFEAGMGAAPTGLGAAGAAAGGAAAGSGLANGSSLLSNILTKYVPLGLAGLSAAKSFQNPSANQDLTDMLGIAKSRVQQSEPLFQALNRMALSGLPSFAKQ